MNTTDVQLEKTNFLVVNNSPEYSDSDTPDELFEDSEQDESGWDSYDEYDEIVEANQADDIIKIIEGDWKCF